MSDAENNGKNAHQALVLVVDDNQPAVEMLTTLFSSDGYAVISAYDGQEALEKIHQYMPDLILLDIMMPRIDGLEVLRRLRNDPKVSMIPTVLITAKDRPADIAQGLEIGADDYIPKPIKPRELLARARSKIESYNLRRALEIRKKDLEALLRASEQLNNQLAVEPLVELILFLVIDLLPCDVAVLTRLDDAGQPLQRQIIGGDGATLDIAVHDDSLIRYFQSSEEQDVISWSRNEYHLTDGYDCGLAIALRHAEDLLGVITLVSSQPFDEKRKPVVMSIGRQATMALRNAELYQLKANYATELERTVEERTAELRSAQQLLVQAEKLASVGRLAAGIAHEINNPLQPILINLELLVEDLEAASTIDTDRVLGDVRETHRSAQRISRIVERLLEFTRKRDDAAPDVEIVNVAVALENVVTLSRKYFQQANIGIKLDVDPQPSVYGNRDQLEQVFLNLMLNAKSAMEATRRDGRRLLVNGYEADGEIVIEFSDNGQGIPPDMLNKIFEPFISGRENGSGLGLFISYGILRDHNGKIQVTSTVGEGTTFTLRLPLVDMTDDDIEGDD